MTLVSAAMPCPSATNAVAPRAAGSGRVPGLLRKLPNPYGLHNQAPARLRLAVSRSSAGEGGARVDTEAFGDYTSTEFENRKVAEYVELFKLADTDK